MNINFDYYFENYEDNEIFKKLIIGIENVWDLHKNKKDFLEKELVQKDLKQNNGELMGDNISLFRNLLYWRRNQDI